MLYNRMAHNLIAYYGAPSVYTTGNPQISYVHGSWHTDLKKNPYNLIENIQPPSYKRHTHTICHNLKINGYYFNDGTVKLFNLTNADYNLIQHIYIKVDVNTCRKIIFKLDNDIMAQKISFEFDIELIRLHHDYYNDIIMYEDDNHIMFKLPTYFSDNGVNLFANIGHPLIVIYGDNNAMVYADYIKLDTVEHHRYMTNWTNDKFEVLIKHIYYYSVDGGNSTLDSMNITLTEIIISFEEEYNGNLKLTYHRAYGDVITTVEYDAMQCKYINKNKLKINNRSNDYVITFSIDPMSKKPDGNIYVDKIGIQLNNYNGKYNVMFIGHNALRCIDQKYSIGYPTEYPSGHKIIIDNKDILDIDKLAIDI
jgi:hypothetical protein